MLGAFVLTSLEAEHPRDVAVVRESGLIQEADVKVLRHLQVGGAGTLSS